MKLTLVFIFILSAFVDNTVAQCKANDSTLMGASASSDVYYNLKNSTISTVSNTNWHLAFSVLPFASPSNPALSVGIRVNSGGNGTILKKLDNANPANWRSIDTTGLSALPQLIDSDSTWNLSAFTLGYNYSGDIFNFIWGTYNQTTHNVTGTKVFILQNKVAGIAKKVFVKQLIYDSLWNVIISNIDNSDSINLTINKKHYPNKMFVYYNALTNQVIDREPILNSWDLLWTKYVTWVSSSQGSGYYPVVGVLNNPKVYIEKNYGKKCNEVWFNNRTSKTEPSISAIGYNWKTFTGTAYAITDTLVYFIKGQDSNIYKLSFISFVGGGLGKTVMNIYESTTEISEKEIKSYKIFPNPSNGVIYIESKSDIKKVDIFDIQGNNVFRNDKIDEIDLSTLSQGVYLIKIITSERVYYQKIIKE